MFCRNCKHDFNFDKVAANTKAAGGAILRNSCVTTDFLLENFSCSAILYCSVFSCSGSRLVNLLGKIARLSFQMRRCPSCSYTNRIWMESRAVPLQFTKPRRSSYQYEVFQVTLLVSEELGCTNYKHNFSGCKC